MAVTKNLYLNFDLKKLYIDSNARNNLGVTVSHLNPNPLAIGVGLGYRF